jgi:mRNA interferase HigB
MRYDRFMHLITRKTLRFFWQQHPDSKTALERWSKIISQNNFDNFSQLRNTFPSADKVGNLIVFNIGGNKYRLIAAVHFNRHKVYIRHILTHQQYDKGDWKQ